MKATSLPQQPNINRTLKNNLQKRIKDPEEIRRYPGDGYASNTFVFLLFKKQLTRKISHYQAAKKRNRTHKNQVCK
jgi:hypothetical protein